MKYVVATVLVILLVFLGFQVYQIIDREIDEANLSKIDSLDVNNQNISVDILENSNTYTQRLSTYKDIRHDLLESVKDHLLTDKPTVYYFENNALMAYETSEDLSLEINGSCIVLLKDADYQTNIPKSDYEIFQQDDFILIRFTPSQTGQYFLDGHLRIDISILGF